jgi:hypothetical protein
MTGVVLVLHGTVDALDMIEVVLSVMVNTVDTIEMALKIWKYGWGLYSGQLKYVAVLCIFPCLKEKKRS